jgi:hypothetical protein
VLLGAVLPRLDAVHLMVLSILGAIKMEDVELAPMQILPKFLEFFPTVWRD